MRDRVRLATTVPCTRWEGRSHGGTSPVRTLLLEHEPLVRSVVFLAVLAAMAVAEALWPRRRRELPRLLRWSGNLGLVVVDALALRLAFPVLAVGVALAAEAHGFGLLQALAVPRWLAVPVSIVVLDFAVWAQHVLFHAVPLFWRLHRVHHADTEVDATTGVRFHPIEILLSMGLKMAVVAALGAPAEGVVLFEILLNGSALFNHANLRLPPRLDAALRLVFVTPDMHRVHHSVRPEETHSNFGFCLSLWDRLFGTYRAQPAAGHEGMVLGLPVFRDPAEQRLDRLLLQPFRRPPGAPGAGAHAGRRADAPAALHSRAGGL